MSELNDIQRMVKLLAIGVEAQAARLPDRVGPGESQVVYYWFLLKYVLTGLGCEMDKKQLSKVFGNAAPQRGHPLKDGANRNLLRSAGV
jgi:hypothetical protein